MDQLWHLSLGGSFVCLSYCKGRASATLRTFRLLGEWRLLPALSCHTLPLDCYFEVTVVLRIWTPSCTRVVPRENIFRTWISRGHLPLPPTRSLSRSVTAQKKKAPRDAGGAQEVMMSCCPEELHETCSVLQSYWIVLATEENALLALLPTKRTVPTTSTKITASITAYSAMS